MQTEHFVLSAWDSTTPGISGVFVDDDQEFPTTALISAGFHGVQKGKVPTFLDSGASDTMFVSRESFTDYIPMSPRIGDSAKAMDGNFEIIGE